MLRMALRNLWSNKKSTLLTVLGLMVGSSLVTSTLVVYSSVKTSQEAYINQHFGVISDDIPATGQKNLSNPYFTNDDISKMKYSIGKEQTTLPNILPTVSFETSLFTRDLKGKPIHISPKTYIQGFNVNEAKRFDPTGIKEHEVDFDLDKYQILLPQHIADELMLSIGDSVFLSVANHTSYELTVKGYISEQGLLGYRGIHNGYSTANVSLDTARMIKGLKDDEYSNLLVSSNESIGLEWETIPVRSIVEKDLRVTNEIITMFSMTSMNALFIGLVLIGCVMMMFSEERRKQTLILLKIGMSRKDAAKLFRIEGMLYAGISSFIGMMIGIVLAYYLFQELRQTLTMGLHKYHLQYQFTIKIWPLLGGLFIGVSLAYIFIWFISRYHVKMPITGSSYDAYQVGIKNENRTYKKIRFILANGLLLIGIILSLNPQIKEMFSHFYPPFLFLTSTIVLMLLVVVTFQWLHLLKKGIHVLLKPFATISLITRFALGYLNVNRVRNNLVMIMFSLVFFLLTLANFLSGQIIAEKKHGFDARNALGGYDLIATANRNVDTNDLQSWMKAPEYLNAKSIEHAATVSHLYWTTFDYGNYARSFTINGVNDTFADNTELTFVDRDRQFTGDRSAWKELANNPESIVLSQPVHALPGNEGYSIGDLFPLTYEGKTHWKKIIAIVREEFEHYEYTPSTGVWVSERELTSIETDERVIQTSLLFRLADNKLDHELFDGMEKEISLHNVYPLIRPYDDWPILMTTFLFNFELFSGISIVTSLVGLAIIMLRGLNERYRHFSLVRAIGARREIIFWSVFMEGAFLSTIGITLGIMTGSYTGYWILQSSPDAVDSLKYFPLFKIAFYYFIGLVVATICTVIPALKATKTNPTDASRHVG